MGKVRYMGKAVGKVYGVYDRQVPGPGSYYRTKEEAIASWVNVRTEDGFLVGEDKTFGFNEVLRSWDLIGEEVGNSVVICEVGESHVIVGVFTSFEAAVQYIKAFIPNVTVEETEECVYVEEAVVHYVFRLTEWDLG